MSLDIKKISIAEAHKLLDDKVISSVELTKAVLSEIEKKNTDINAYLEVFDDCLEQARLCDERIAKGDKAPLLGIPIAMKDNILIKGRRVSAASKILEGYTAVYDATATKKLRDAGAVFIGRTNMDEFAMGGSTENSAFSVVKNPHDNTRVAGGSSGGSAGAVAMGGAIASLGSDTGGSVRQPASFCGLVGLKPTYGSVSRHGLIAMGSSLDQIAPMTRTVSDNELIHNILAGADVMDSTTIPDKARISDPSVGKRTIGVPRGFLTEGVDKQVLDVFEESLKRLKALGYTIKDIELPYVKYSLAVYYVIMPAEASTNLSRFDGVRYGLHKGGANLLEDYRASRGAGFGPEVRRRITLGTYVLSAGYYDAYYTKAQAVRRLIAEDFNRAFKEVDAIITPTAPTPAFKIGSKTKDPLTMYLEDIFTTPANIAGIPALSVPAGFAHVDGVDLPVGVQFMGRPLEENVLFTIGKEFCGEV